MPGLGFHLRLPSHGPAALTPSSCAGGGAMPLPCTTDLPLAQHPQEPLPCGWSRHGENDWLLLWLVARLATFPLTRQTVDCKLA